MKEVTYEDWQKNTAPRMMWVWNDDIEAMEKRKVVYVIKDDFASCPVLAVSEEDSSFCSYGFCAEIEKQRQRQRQMTNKELSRWLREKPTREWKCKDGDSVCSVYDYGEKYADEEVHDSILIREGNGEWREPLVEVEE